MQVICLKIGCETACNIHKFGIILPIVHDAAKIVCSSKQKWSSLNCVHLFITLAPPPVLCFSTTQVSAQSFRCLWALFMDITFILVYFQDCNCFNYCQSL